MERATSGRGDQWPIDHPQAPRNSRRVIVPSSSVLPPASRCALSAPRTGLSHTVVGTIAARAGIHSSCRHGPPPWPAHRIDELRQLRSEGLSMGEIAQRLGVSKTTVHKLINRHADAGGPHEEEEQQRKRTRSPNRAIAARVAAGASHSKAAAEFGNSPQRVSQIMLALRGA